MAALTAALLAASVGSQFFQQRNQASAAEAQGRYERAQSEQNAQLAEWQAEDALARGKIAVGTQVGQQRQAVGAARAAGGGSGTAPSTYAQDQIESLGAFDRTVISNNAAREAWGYRTEAAQQRGQGDLAYQSSRNTARSLRAASYGTLLTGGVQGVNMYQQWRKDNPTKSVV